MRVWCASDSISCSVDIDQNGWCECHVPCVLCWFLCAGVCVLVCLCWFVFVGVCVWAAMVVHPGDVHLNMYANLSVCLCACVVV